MANYLECCEQLQFQHGPIEQLSSTTTWENVHSSPIAISESLDLLVIALGDKLDIYKCSEYGSALITKASDRDKGEICIEKSRIKAINLSKDILSISICEAKPLLAYRLISCDSGILFLQDLSHKPSVLPKSQCLSWSNSSLLCYQADKPSISIYDFKDVDEDFKLPSAVLSDSKFTGDVVISGLNGGDECCWAVAQSIPPLFVTVSLKSDEGKGSKIVISDAVSVLEQNFENECKIAGICIINAFKILIALLTKIEDRVDSTISYYELDKLSKPVFSIENELFVQDEVFGENLSDPFSSTVSFLHFPFLNLIFVSGSHTSQVLLLGYGKTWNDQWSVLEMDEGCALEVSDSQECPRGLLITRTFKEVLRRRHAQVDTPPLVNPPLVILAQRDCSLALHYLVTTHHVPELKVEGEKSNKFPSSLPLIERFYKEGVKAGSNLPTHERDARDTLVEALTKAFALVDQALFVDNKAYSPSEPKVDETKPLQYEYNIDKSQYDLSRVYDFISEFVCFLTNQHFRPSSSDFEKKLTEFELKAHSRIEWLKSNKLGSNEFIFSHFRNEMVEASKLYSSYLLEPGFSQLDVNQYLNLLDYQNLFRHYEEQIAFRRLLTDRVRQGYSESPVDTSQLAGTDPLKLTINDAIFEKSQGYSKASTEFLNNLFGTKLKIREERTESIPVKAPEPSKDLKSPEPPKPLDKPEEPQKTEQAIKADFSSMLADGANLTGSGVFTRQSYGFDDSSSLAKSSLQLGSANQVSQPVVTATPTFGGFSSFAGSGKSFTELAQSASGGGFSGFGGGFGSVGFGQSDFKGFTSGAGGFGEGGPKTFSNVPAVNQAQQPPSGDLWNRPRQADPLN